MCFRQLYIRRVTTCQEAVFSMQHRVLHDIKKRSRSSLSAQLHVHRAMRDIQYLRCAASSSDPLRRQSDHHHHPIAIPVCGTRIVAQKHLAIISVVEDCAGVAVDLALYHFGSRCCRTPTRSASEGIRPERLIPTSDRLVGW